MTRAQRIDELTRMVVELCGDAETYLSYRQIAAVLEEVAASYRADAPARRTRDGA